MDAGTPSPTGELPANEITQSNQERKFQSEKNFRRGISAKIESPDLLVQCSGVFFVVNGVPRNFIYLILWFTELPTRRRMGLLRRPERMVRPNEVFLGGQWMLSINPSAFRLCSMNPCGTLMSTNVLFGAAFW